jgi:hypothetical protein
MPFLVALVAFDPYRHHRLPLLPLPSFVFFDLQSCPYAWTIIAVSFERLLKGELLSFPTTFTGVERFKLGFGRLSVTNRLC